MINLYQLKVSNTPLDNHYQLIDKIGGGGFSEVWLAEDLRSQVKVALKVYSSVQDMDSEGIKMFRKEFSLVCNLNHTNILKPFTFDIFQGCPYIVLPYCETGSAAQYVGKLTENELWDFVGQVAAGLAYIHKHNIIHQDIKPGNVLINADGQMMITDFGISTGLRKTMRRSANKTDDSARDGTIAYMSYECLKENPINVIARDIWAFGATLYEFATGEVPFGEYGGITQRAEGGKIPNVNADISSDLKELIRRCLAMEPWDRPNAEELVEMVEQHKNGVILNRRNWKKIGALAVAIAILPIGYFVYPHIVAKQSPKEKHMVVAKINPNDKILMSKVEEATQMVNEEKGKRNIETRNEQKLGAAAKLYQEAMALQATDSIKKKATDDWVEFQNVIDETYTYLYKKGVEYSNMGAEEAAKTFGRRSRELKDYASTSIQQAK